MTRNAARTYADITKEIESLQKEAQEVRKKEVAEVIGRINEAIAFYGLRPADLRFTGKRAGAKPNAGDATKKAPAQRKTLQAKYRDDKGNAWSGRGPRPRWLREALEQGRTLEEFAG
ncbi:histone family protein nucleoid-structuring protein H-NS [Delftia sp. Cs1-4]|uniref:H-NS histone family protein n=1 Tax=Delftia sp. (strain Cs1-4) TaxID=742013 RepID=UPI00020E7A77|nr:H-NS histone family protein [Delftia sp. Cs1-4]AEF88731.1 histone family protein nucleoid-structuring protein H-NS [Delftia sp. Cs1-4]